MRKKLSLFAILAILAGIVFNVIISSHQIDSAQAATLPAVPAGLKNTFSIGLANQPGNVGWMTGSGATWDARYQYLAGGVNTGSGWSTWNSPAGAFASYYLSDSANNNYLPVLTYYQLLQSAPASGSSEGDKDYNNLNNASTMKAYYADFKLLMDQIRAFGKTAIVHVEPDLWGFLQEKNANPNNLAASVASSGYGDVVAGYPNTVAGFAKALVALRDKYAPNALLAYHISPWSSTYGDISSNKSSTFNVAGAAQDTANFYLQTGANFNLMFYDIADRDAALYQSWGDPNRWWDTTNTTYPNFNRFNQFALAITTATGKRGMLWQVPVGNTLYKSVNNTNHHWQDNKAQYYLNDTSYQHLQDLANSGIIGILFGAGDGNTTSYNDGAGDGITNPAPINGNNLTASYSDDDGGNLRIQAKAYYSHGALTLPSSGSAPAPTATPTQAPTATPTKAPTATPTQAPTATAAPAPGAGTGLNAAYFTNKTLSGTPTVQRVDGTVNFDWGMGSPAANIPADNFSARWTGQVKALSTGAYTFCTQADDGVNLWVNGVQLVNDWVDQGTTEKCGNISLTQNQLYSIKMEYYENGGTAVAKLLWQGPSVAKQAIPQSQLFTSGGATPTATPAPTQAPTAPTSWVINTTTSGAMTSGSTVTFTSKFTAPSNGSYILDVEVYNLANNAKVGQWAPTQNLSAGQTVTLTNTLALPAGSYIVKQGVFNTSWSMIAWQDGATFQVK